MNPAEYGAHLASIAAPPSSAQIEAAARILATIEDVAA